MYEEIVNEDGSTVIKKTDGGNIWWIPAVEENRMYKEYLEWKQGNN